MGGRIGCTWRQRLVDASISSWSYQICDKKNFCKVHSKNTRTRYLLSRRVINSSSRNKFKTFRLSSHTCYFTLSSKTYTFYLCCSSHERPTQHATKRENEAVPSAFRWPYGINSYSTHDEIQLSKKLSWMYSRWLCRIIKPQPISGRPKWSNYFKKNT